MSTSDHSAKEYDDSPPRNGIILFYAVLTVFCLVGVKFLLDSYFVKTMDGEIHDKVLTQGFDEVNELRAKEQAALADSIAAAKKQVATGRTASPLIRPASGQGAPEVQGWTQLGRKVEGAAAPAAATPAPPGAPAGQPETSASPGKVPPPTTNPGPGLNTNEKKPTSTVNPASRPN
jgi:hypothetical protein